MSTQEKTSMPRPAVQAINHLGWAMISELCDGGVPPSGSAVSPLSIAIALGMLAGGADEPKCSQLCQKLGLGDLNDLKSAFLTIQNTLTAASDVGRQFTAANALFADQSTTVFPTYTNLLESFSAHIDDSFPLLVEGTEEINAWVADKTNGMIPKMLSREDLAPAHMVLINALYFKAAWKHKFDPRNTVSDYPFNTTPHKTTPVDMMFFRNQEHLVHYGKEYTAVLLPYTSTSRSRWSFIAYLPNRNASVSDMLPDIQREGIPQGFARTRLERLGLPKFELRTQESIAPLLFDLGYPISGNFPGIGTGMNMVSQIIHSVAILLDENGTEAAAATAVVMTRSVRRSPPSLIFDRPFAFSIVAEDLGLVLFTGLYSVA